MFALLLKAAYYRDLYFNHLIFSIHLHTVGYIVLALMLPIENLASEYVGLVIAQVASLIYFLAYFVIAAHRVYGSSWPAVVLKSGAVLFGYMIVVSIAIENTSSFLIIAD